MSGGDQFYSTLVIDLGERRLAQPTYCFVDLTVLRCCNLGGWAALSLRYSASHMTFFSFGIQKNTAPIGKYD